MDSKFLLISNYTRNRMKLERFLRKISMVTHRQPDVVEFNRLEKSGLEKYDAAVLTGTDSKRGLPDVYPEYKREIELIRRFNGPILGICFGHQLISMAFRSMITMLNHPHIGFREVRILTKDRLFEGLKPVIRVYESHGRTVNRVPASFIELSRAKDNSLEATRHRDRLIYGVQFHPERFSVEYPDGKKILENFFTMSVSESD